MRYGAIVIAFNEFHELELGVKTSMTTVGFSLTGKRISLGNVGWFGIILSAWKKFVAPPFTLLQS